jgi:hypothetical protein
MKGMKRTVLIGWAVLASLAFATAGSGPAVASNTLREQSNLVLDPAGWKALEVENPRGPVDVRSSSDGRVHLVAVKIVHGQTRKQSARIAQQIEVTTERIEGRYVVAVRYPQRSDVRIGFWDLVSGVEFPRAQVRLEIEAPPGLSLRLRSSSGDLSSEDRTGPQTFETRSGDVTVRGARGPLEASTTSGDISATTIGAARLRASSGDVTVSDARGPLSVRTSSGDIQVKGAADSLRLTASSGDIQVDAAPRGLAAETNSGEIDAPEIAGWAHLRTSSGEIGLGLRAPLRRAEISSVSGNVRARIASGLGCVLDARTTSGTIDLAIPLTLGTSDRHAVSGRVAGGGAAVELHTISGDITVESGGR